MTVAGKGSSADERKRLGQYFTGVPLARVLAALGEAASADSLLDPMAGSGDMIVAACAVGSKAARVTAVEIDPLVARACLERARTLNRPHVEVRTANAFDPATWRADASTSWELVITNPPYVRYQRATRRSDARFAVPSATEVRQGLLEIIAGRETLTTRERDALLFLTEGYSGLADLAVPSWLLCASLVSPGGRLAMVVPDTWLSRDYALPILYVLRRFFDVEYVVEDGEASWFEDALVRTTLVVARRTKARSTACSRVTTRYVAARVTPEAGNARSIVGTLFRTSRTPERRFAETLRLIAVSGQSIAVPGLSAQRTDDAQFRDRLIAQAGLTSWGKLLEPQLYRSGAGKASPYVMPSGVRALVGDLSSRVGTLSDLGWFVGQGLRTGANRFFYGEALSTDGDSVLLQVDRELTPEPIRVPAALVRTAVRKQSDLARGDTKHSPGRLIFLEDHALEEDIAAAAACGVRVPYEPIPEPLASHVRRAAGLRVASGGHVRLLPELSAVAPNVRHIDPSRPDRIPRYWYQLPRLTSRHTGLLFLPRVNHGHATVMANTAGVVIDANFSTLWPARANAIPAFALLALLRSTWCRAVLESCGTVLGGGALKLEATQLRRAPLPLVQQPLVERLEKLGAAIVAGAEDAIAAVDELVRESFGWTGRRRGLEDSLRALADDLVKRRCRQRRGQLAS